MSRSLRGSFHCPDRCEDGLVDVATRPARLKWMRVAWALVPAVLFLGVLTFALDRAGGPPGPGDPAPNFEAQPLDGDGAPVSLSDFRGRPVLLNFWASWCGPCLDEAPMLRRAHDLFGDKVAFIGVDVRDSRTDALEFVRRHGVDYVQVRDDRLGVYRAYGLTGQPESFLIDGNGVVVQHVQGPFPSESDLFSLLENLVRRG
jgi:cytochrome c biogenesis protein CcmG, thiol:disulfide interchange protein DsbE